MAGALCALALVAGLSLALSTGTSRQASAGEPKVSLDPVDRELPAFQLEALVGETWSPTTLAGKPWIVNFWASWCGPCVEEMPAMNRARESLEGDGIGMIAINAGEGREVVDAFLDRLAIDFPILLGDGATTLPDWEVRALPTTLVVDARGRIVFEALGPRDWDDAALLDRVRALR